eukprot:g1524.t1
MISQRQLKRAGKSKRKKDREHRKKRSNTRASSAANAALSKAKNKPGAPLGTNAAKSRLFLKRGEKEVIFDVLDSLDRLQARRVASDANVSDAAESGGVRGVMKKSGKEPPPAAPESGSGAAPLPARPGTKIWTTKDVRKLEKRRNKQERSLAKEIKADKKAAKASAKIKARAARRAVDPASTNVRIDITTPHKSKEKKTVVITRCSNLNELLKTAKSKFNRKPNKLKKPTRAFLVEMGTKGAKNVEEMKDTYSMCDGDLIMVTENDTLPEGFTPSEGAQARDGETASRKNDDRKEKTPCIDESPLTSSPRNSEVVTPTVSKVQRMRAAYKRHCRGDISGKRSSAGQREKRSSAVEEQEWLVARAASALGSSKFNAMQEIRQSLPCGARRTEIIDTINAHSVVVISGETGCGKTTQIPQFILEDAVHRGVGGSCQIICTQPRRISAIGVSTRVAAERDEKIGDVVGYQIRLERRVSMHTHLVFCTTGILLRRLAGDPDLVGVTHIVLDEVHEREILSDFLLILLRDLLRTRRPDLKIILMSATINAGMFAKYFSAKNLLAVATKGESTSAKGKAYKERTLRIVDGMDQSKINYDLIARVVELFCSKSFCEKLDGCSTASVAPPSEKDEDAFAILIFMPGLGEITKMCKILRERANSIGRGGTSVLILPLHGSLSSREQTRVFSRPPVGVRKIVISTNIAETSVTIDDIVCVIDSGRVKEIQYNETSNCPALVETWISKASARQRLGRAGRVRPGVCFQMFSQTQHDALLDFQVPEIKRKPLEDLILQIRLLQLDEGSSPTEFLQRAIEAPSTSAIENAMSTLRRMGALSSNREGGINGDVSSINELTPLGFHLANLPVGAKLGKLLLFGCLFRCIEPILTIAAAMSCRSPFVSPQNAREDARRAKAMFAQYQSDLLTIARAFQCWEMVRNFGKKSRNGEGFSKDLGNKFPYQHTHDFCRDYYLNDKTLTMISNLREQFRRQLKDIGFLRSEAHFATESASGVASPMLSLFNNEELEGKCNGNGRDVGILRCVICAALYPNVVCIRRADTRGYAGSRRKKERYTTRTEEVHVHPGSINFKNSLKKEAWLMYNEKQMTTRMYMYDTNVVTPYMLFLWGGNVAFSYADEIIRIDDWIELKSTAEAFTLFKRLRAEIQRTLASRIENPNSDTSAQDERIVIDAISVLLS